MRAILVGAGGVARELLRRLGDLWVVTVVDRSPDRLERARQIRAVPTVEGDGSSVVVLKRAGLEGADAFVAATGDDESNLEGCRLARRAGVRRLVAVVHDPQRREEFRELGVTLVSPYALAARRIELSLETRRVSSVAFADGRAEAVEFRIGPDSPVCGRSLEELRASSWIVGVILRGDRLIVPHGDTTLEAGDLVTVVGAGADFAEMVRTFTSGEARFPLDFGKRVAIPVEDESDLDGVFSEAIHMVRGSRASSLLLVHRDPNRMRDDAAAARVERLLQRAPELAQGVEVRTRSVDRKPLRAVGHIHSSESVGVIVLKSGSNGGMTARWNRLRAAGLVRSSGRPVLLARGSQPYRRILVPARQTAAGHAAVRAAIDLARFARAELVGVSVLDPLFLTGPAEPDEAGREIAWLEEEAAVHGVKVHSIVERGNPVRTLRRLSEEVDLVVLGSANRFPGQGIGSLVARACSKSVLLVPV